MSIKFLDTEPHVSERSSVRIGVEVDGRRIVVEILFEVLRDHFGATSEEGADEIRRIYVSDKRKFRRVIERVFETNPGRFQFDQAQIVSKDFTAEGVPDDKEPSN